MTESFSLWRKDKFIMTESFSGDHFIGVKALWGENNLECSFVNIYAPCDLQRKKELWRCLVEVMRSRGGDLWCVGGDFNAVRVEGERRGVSSYWREDDMKCFDEFITEAELVDLPLVGRKYTWYKTDGKCMSRLDRFLVSNAWLSHWPHTTQWGLSRGVSDHCAILLKNEDINWGPKPFRVKCGGEGCICTKGETQALKM
uniref:Endonuclease/exonuclease/phosphatase domain-containing protein n=1 Tax=Cajanus cajan TaxID=3821 RepID=A0A151SQ24_CAJCA|nr:hypothetical protein KK1_003144 [Cajanus cajan]